MLPRTSPRRYRRPTLTRRDHSVGGGITEPSPRAPLLGYRPDPIPLSQHVDDEVIEAAGSLVESLDVIPERLFYDLGPSSEHRFHRVEGALHELRRHAAGRHTTGHGIGLSVPSDMPLDEPLLDVVADVSESLEFSWYSGVGTRKHVLAADAVSAKHRV